eukprot:TRINITY_DN1999_c1_g2_i1.p1 TRINITY_DN1999_c1_g2~~TRINITY_DN1999_c1_g2_i1.p1  ORF type:complete len:480 (+),score=97.80 TRINITY_DN1999_c1_g2_i1:80-1441(+)
MCASFFQEVPPESGLHPRAPAELHCPAANERQRSGCLAEAVLVGALSPAGLPQTALQWQDSAPGTPCGSFGHSDTASACDSPTFDTYQVYDQVFTVPSAYTVEGAIGRGSFGVVCRARVSGGGVPHARTAVAIKKVPVPHCPAMLQRLMREVTLLSTMHHDNVIGLDDLFIVDEADGGQGLYMVTELMENNLADAISEMRLELDHVCALAAQLFAGLAHIHHQGVIHRDLKPQNIVVNADCDLRIVDFGLARDEGGEDEDMTSYVVTRWYRPPELLLQSHQYTSGVDLWSAGCIVVEMVTGEVLFPGTDCRSQLRLIIDAVGGSAEAAAECGVGSAGVNFVRRLCHASIPPTDLCETLADRIESPEHADIVAFCQRELLRFAPEERCSAAEAAAADCWREYSRPGEPGPCRPSARLQRQLRAIDGAEEEQLRDLLRRLAAAYRGPDPQPSRRG